MNSLKKGNIIVLGKNKRPCKVTEIKKSAPGKHGHAQYSVFGKDVIHNKKVNDIFKHHDHYQEVETSRVTYAGIDEQNGVLSLINDDGETIEMNMPDNNKLRNKLEKNRENFGVIVMNLRWEVKDDVFNTAQVVEDIVKGSM